MEPVFLLSLPRSGSTYLQRLLARHPAIATRSEPWLLLPLIYATRRHGAFAEYGHATAVRAIEDFSADLPNGLATLRRALADAARNLYGAAAGRPEARYFLDKTPRYHLLVEDLFELFPNGRFVFLWRNPLAVAASMIETFGDGRWNLHGYVIDLEIGLARLVAGYEGHPDRALAVRFEDLKDRPEEACGRIFDYLDLDPAELAGSGREVHLVGRYGDRAGTPGVDPALKWRAVMTNPFRKAWCRRYLQRIGQARLRTMGYDQHELLTAIDQIPTSIRQLPSDLVRYVYGVAHAGLELRLMKAKWRRGGRSVLVPHY